MERKVANDTFVCFDKSRYSVPPAYIGKEVEVSSLAGTVVIRCQNAIIAEHAEAENAGKTVMAPTHIEELWRSTLNLSPLNGKRHCNVNMVEAVEQRPLERYEEACS